MISLSVSVGMYAAGFCFVVQKPHRVDPVRCWQINFVRRQRCLGFSVPGIMLVTSQIGQALHIRYGAVEPEHLLGISVLADGFGGCCWWWARPQLCTYVPLPPALHLQCDEKRTLMIVKYVRACRYLAAL